jgi:hypothetical protein
MIDWLSPPLLEAIYDLTVKDGFWFYFSSLNHTHQKGGTLAYTPDLTIAASATLRRIAWAVGKPMTRTLDDIFTKLPALMDKDKVCECCKGPSACSICGFGNIKQKGGAPP